MAVSLANGEFDTSTPVQDIRPGNEMLTLTLHESP
jgi:hypothetical protein